MSSPPCTENVYWFVLAESVKLSKAQVMRAWCRFAEVPPLDFPVDESTPPTLTSRDTWLLWRLPRARLLGLACAVAGDLTGAVAGTSKQASGTRGATADVAKGPELRARGEESHGEVTHPWSAALVVPRAAHIPAARTDVRKEDGSTFRSLRAKTPVAP